MTIRNLPKAKAFVKPDGYEWDAPKDVLAKWAPQAAEADDGATISIYDVIGQDYWTGDGVTAKRVAGALRAIGPNPVEVLVNSPGGDMFEGLAIYNLLADHPAEVTVKVMGMAASAASIIAMAADKLVMGRGSFLMIHNCWGVVIGDQNDMRTAAATFAEFDTAMAGIYAAQSGQEQSAISEMMDAETWIGAQKAIDLGFCETITDDALEPSAASAVNPQLSAKRRLDHILASAGVSRSERRALMRETAGTQDAASLATQDAGPDVQAALAGLLETLKG
jgi:ATP-dependent protease ClpP protease subunit